MMQIQSIDCRRKCMEMLAFQGKYCCVVRAMISLESFVSMTA